MGDKYDLTYKSIDELEEDTTSSESGDFFIRYDGTAKEFKKVDATSSLSLAGVNATASEINAVADVSARIVNTTGNLTLTAASHGDRIVTVDKADGAALVLPAASGSGNRYKVIITTAITSNSTSTTFSTALSSFL